MKNNLHIILGILIIFTAFLAANAQIYTGRATIDCEDSDDADFFTKGTTTVNGEELSDYCDGDVLVEYYCVKKDLRVKVYECPTSCKEGACLKGPEKEPDKKGKALPLGIVQDQIEIGEFIGDVREVVTERDMPALRSGIISTKSGSTEYKQYIRFKATDLASGRVLFAEDENDEVGDFLVFDKENDTFEYELQFAGGFESEISGTSLPDLEDETLHILDRVYRITDARLNDNKVTLKLIAGDFPSTLEEGQTKTYRIQDTEVTIQALSIDGTERTVIFSVNGKRTSKLSKGEIEFIEGIVIGVKTIIISEAAEGADLVRLAMGAEKIEFVDTDYTDDNFKQTIRINGNSISSGYTKIKGTKSGDDFEILSIKYRIKPDAKKGRDVFVPPKKGLREFLEDPEVMLGNWDIIYQGLSSEEAFSHLKIDPSGDDEYNLEFQNNRGNKYNIPLVSNNGGNLELGDDSNKLYFIEGANNSDFMVAQQDYFVLTNRNDRTGVSNIVRYSSIDTSSATLHFNEEAEGSKSVPYTGTVGSGASGDLVIAGTTYKVFIGPAPEHKLAIDFTGNGAVNGGEANIVIAGGGLLDLGTTTTPNDNFSITLTTEAKQFDTRTADEVITISILKEGNDVDLNLPTQGSLSIESETGKNIALSNYGIYFKQEKDNPDELTVRYPKSQAIASIELIFYETPSAEVEVKKEPPKQKEEPKPKPEPKEEPKPKKEEPKPKVRYVERDPWYARWFAAIARLFTE